jgi:hypothetical protein
MGHRGQRRACRSAKRPLRAHSDTLAHDPGIATRLRILGNERTFTDRTPPPNYVEVSISSGHRVDPAPYITEPAARGRLISPLQYAKRRISCHHRMRLGNPPPMPRQTSPCVQPKSAGMPTSGEEPFFDHGPKWVMVSGCRGESTVPYSAESSVRRASTDSALTDVTDFAERGAQLYLAPVTLPPNKPSTPAQGGPPSQPPPVVTTGTSEDPHDLQCVSRLGTTVEISACGMAGGPASTGKVSRCSDPPHAMGKSGGTHNSAEGATQDEFQSGPARRNPGMVAAPTGRPAPGVSGCLQTLHMKFRSAVTEHTSTRCNHYHRLRADGR